MSFLGSLNAEGPHPQGVVEDGPVSDSARLARDAPDSSEGWVGIWQRVEGENCGGDRSKGRK